ncbi:chaperone protein, dnaJ family [Pedobacter sp. BAL39]|uniref:DnaJ C-terminal domain-containing protein n=1 Tax=Pedobacter sp. BAL39 TaxID=391596 RepID=UPI0001559402|nr:J domain-containing protein [Pedobacter sp. BAL39]EDM36880.1 chaperone protein, dnaJ family [Pedobacter sp. BAL39]
MAFIDYYKILGIDKKASQDDIKKAYRKLARKYHPDLNPNDQAANKKFQEINEANEALSDPEKRKKYDEYGTNWKNAEQYEQAGQSQSRSRGSGQNPFSGGGFGGGDFSDFFESMFGGSAAGRGGSPRYKGQDYNAELKLNLRDAFSTHKQTLTVNGKNIRITIPAGIADGQTIKLSGHGGPGTNKGPAGDLFITIHISEDSTFKRLHNDLYSNQELDLYTAVLGGEVMVDTFDGKVKLKVPAGTQNGTKVRLKGKGFPVYKKEGEVGSLYITYQIKIPTDLDEKQIALFRELQQGN